MKACRKSPGEKYENRQINDDIEKREDRICEGMVEQKVINGDSDGEGEEKHQAGNINPAMLVIIIQLETFPELP